MNKILGLTKKEWLISISISVIGTLLFLFCFYLTPTIYIDLPSVYYSTATQECSYIKIKGKKFDCTNMPDKHKPIIWIK